MNQVEMESGNFASDMNQIKEMIGKTTTPDASRPAKVHLIHASGQLVENAQARQECGILAGALRLTAGPQTPSANQ
jgi:hypothetical protein